MTGTPTTGPESNLTPLRLPWPYRLSLAAITLAPLMWKVWRIKVLSATDPDNPEGFIAIIGLAGSFPLVIMALLWLFAPVARALAVAQWLTAGYLLMILFVGYSFVSDGGHSSIAPELLPMVPGLHGFLACLIAWRLAKFLSQ